MLLPILLAFYYLVPYDVTITLCCLNTARRACCACACCAALFLRICRLCYDLGSSHSTPSAFLAPTHLPTRTTCDLVTGIVTPLGFNCTTPTAYLAGHALLLQSTSRICGRLPLNTPSTCVCVHFGVRLHTLCHTFHSTVCASCYHTSHTCAAPTAAYLYRFPTATLPLAARGSASHTHLFLFCAAQHALCCAGAATTPTVCSWRLRYRYRSSISIHRAYGLYPIRRHYLMSPLFHHWDSPPTVCATCAVCHLCTADNVKPSLCC